MPDLYFVTSNDQKFAKGQSVCAEYDVRLLQHDFEIDEVQSEDIDYVAKRKAEAAFAAAGQPVIISDDAWQITGLNGFPGTYAKSVNTWFSSEDYVRLTKDLEDRTIIFVQSLVYQDRTTQKLFKRETKGVLLKDVRGERGVSIQKVVSLEPDQTTSISEVIGNGSHYTGENTLKVWHDFATWYKEHDGKD